MHDFFIPTLSLDIYSYKLLKKTFKSSQLLFFVGHPVQNIRFISLNVVLF